MVPSIKIPAHRTQNTIAAAHAAQRIKINPIMTPLTYDVDPGAWILKWIPNQNNQRRAVYAIAELYSPEPRNRHAKTSKDLLCSSGRWFSQVSGPPSILTITGAADVAFEEAPLGFPFGMMKEELNIQNNPKFK